MVYTKLLSVIESLARCNGTFDTELDRLVDDGTIHTEDVPLVVLYAKMLKLSNKLSSTVAAVDEL